jgi:hypothetical protein
MNNHGACKLGRRPAHPGGAESFSLPRHPSLDDRKRMKESCAYHLRVLRSPGKDIGRAPNLGIPCPDTVETGWTKV